MIKRFCDNCGKELTEGEGVTHYLTQGNFGISTKKEDKDIVGFIINDKFGDIQVDTCMKCRKTEFLFFEEMMTKVLSRFTSIPMRKFTIYSLA